MSNTAVHTLLETLEWYDARLIENISKNFDNFITTFNNNIEEISARTPVRIPVQRLNIFYILISVLRTYDVVFGEFFGDKTERIVLSILENYNQKPDDFFEELMKNFSICINQEICNGSFHYISESCAVCSNAYSKA